MDYGIGIQGDYRKGLLNGKEVIFMSYSVKGTTISLTRGDTFKAGIVITKSDGTPYTPSENDKIRFAMKSKYTDPTPLLVKDIPVDTMMLIIESADTKDFPFGQYVYDIQITKENGDVDTFIAKSLLNLMEEVG